MAASSCPDVMVNNVDVVFAVATGGAKCITGKNNNKRRYDYAKGRQNRPYRNGPYDWTRSRLLRGV